MVGAAELSGDPDGGDVHFALLEDLRLGQVGLLVWCRDWNFMPLGEEPVVDGAGLLVVDGQHFRVKGGLAEALLEDAGGVEQFVGDDGVVHAHAALVEDAHDALCRA